jgi:hypothetical protein
MADVDGEGEQAAQTRPDPPAHSNMIHMHMILFIFLTACRPCAKHPVVTPGEPKKTPAESGRFKSFKTGNQSATTFAA